MRIMRMMGIMTAPSPEDTTGAKMLRIQTDLRKRV